MRIIGGLLLLLSPLAAQAFPLSLPSQADLRMAVETAQDSFDFPVGPWRNGDIATQTVEGTLSKSVWRLPDTSLSTLEILAEQRQQLIEQGYDIAYECRTNGCGGFDFRFAVDLIGAPDMLINLGDFRSLTARNGDDWVLLFVSGTRSAQFIQVITIGTPAEPRATLTTPSNAAATTVRLPLIVQLNNSGRVVLDDLSFDTGASSLEDRPFESLNDLADFLRDNPDLTIALVGHTDSSGSLEANIALSKRRATAVLDRLVSDYGVNPDQLEAEGMGYLSPIAPNLTELGRETNRRVEAIITSTE